MVIKAPKAKSADECERLEQLPNIGPSLAADLRRIGIERPADLRGQDAYALYRRLCEATGQRQDPCVLDTFMAATDFMRGAPAAPWWTYTADAQGDLRNALSRGCAAWPECANRPAATRLFAPSPRPAAPNNRSAGSRWRSRRRSMFRALRSRSRADRSAAECRPRRTAPAASNRVRPKRSCRAPGRRG